MSFSRSARARLGATVAASLAATAMFAAPAAANDDEPQNIIVLIADGMGYNQVDQASLYEYGRSNWQARVDGDAGTIEHQDGYGETPNQVYEQADVQLGMSHFSLNRPGYDGEAAWSDFRWAMEGPTDSAAAGTALATGYKAWNGELGQADGVSRQNVAEFAQETGRSAGVVSDVPFGHATPASWAVHVENRGDNEEIANQMVYGDLDVIIGAGHPLYDDDGESRDFEPIWLTQDQYNDLETGNTPFTFAETSGDIEAVAQGNEVPERFFGLAPVAETLQFNRSSLADIEHRRPGAGSGIQTRMNGLPLTADEGFEDAALPFEAERNDIVSLADMSSAALNVLDQNDEGFFLMIEAGAVDWAGHANATAGNVEEMMAFNEANERVYDWVETHSSWDETLVITTADHETGYLDGSYSGPTTDGVDFEDTDEWRHDWDEVPNVWEPLTGSRGQLPADGWYSPDHTHHLVPFFANGAGAERFYDYIQGTDPVRGDYIDNVNVAQQNFEVWGAGEQDESDGIPIDVTVPEPDENGPGTGSLVLSIEDTAGVTLTGGHHIGDARRFLGTLPDVTVTDSRSNAEAGEEGGWTVSGQSSPLASSNGSIASANLGWNPALSESREGVSAGSKVSPARSGGPGLGSPATLGSAGAEGRVGTSTLTAELALETPFSTSSGDYQGELTVSLFPVD